MVGSEHSATNRIAATPTVKVRPDGRNGVRLRVVVLLIAAPTIEIHSSEPKNRLQATRHVFDAVRRFTIVECHWLEGIDCWNILRRLNTFVQRNLHRL